MRSPHQLFQFILLNDSSTLEHVININIPKRRLIVNVPNIVTLMHSVNMFCQRRERSFIVALTIHKIKMVHRFDWNR